MGLLNNRTVYSKMLLDEEETKYKKLILYAKSLPITLIAFES